MDSAHYPQQPVQPTDAQRVMYLEQRVAALEARLPATALLSHRFMQRAWAVFGHYLAASLVVGAIAFVISAVVSLLIALVFGAGLAAWYSSVQGGY